MPPLPRTVRPMKRLPSLAARQRRGAQYGKGNRFRAHSLRCFDFSPTAQGGILAFTPRDKKHPRRWILLTERDHDTNLNGQPCSFFPLHDQNKMLHFPTLKKHVIRSELKRFLFYSRYTNSRGTATIIRSPVFFYPRTVLSKYRR